MNQRPLRSFSPVGSRLLLTILIWTSLDALVWWAMLGVDHDPRFYSIYQVPLSIRIVVVELSDYWMPPSDVFALQHGAVAIALAVVCGRPLARSRVWRERWDLRALIGCLAAFIPWAIVAEAHRHEPWPWFTHNDALLLVYALCCAAAAFGPWSRDMRRTLFVVAGGCSLALVWQIDYFPVTGGPIVLTMVLLAREVIRGSLRQDVFA